MNEKKICFVTCVDNQEVYREALYYINQLDIPKGYETECISIENAASMAQGYNEALRISDAKYKVYMHQDVYIINKSFISDILKIFENDDKIGMLGVVGSKYIPFSDELRGEHGKYGKVFENKNGKIELSTFNEITGEYEEVKAIDGFIMVTQKDIPWREDISFGWSLYNISQVMEFLKSGYKVVVPKQEKCWFIHECQNRTALSKEYEDAFFNEYAEEITRLYLESIKKEEAVNDESLLKWRNYYLSRIRSIKNASGSSLGMNSDNNYNNSSCIEKIDKYLIKKFNIPPKKAGELFEFDSIKALELIIANRSEFMKYIDTAKLFLVDKNFEQAAICCLKAAQYASDNHPGFYTSKELEEILIQCANNLPEVSVDIEIPKFHGDKKKVLHVMTAAYSVGGHTKLVHNWIEKDKNSIHSLLTTDKIDTAPEWLINSVKRSGGWTYSLQQIPSIMSRAALLRKIAYEWADVVVLHIHMCDPVPVLAFGVEGGPPVLFMNHADHVFWIGTSIVDSLINFRESGQALSESKRGIKGSSILPLPLTEYNKTYNKVKLRREMGVDENAVVLLTIATAYKFESLSKIHYIDIIKRILDKNPNTLAIVIGPDNSGIWKEAYKQTNGRILPLGYKKDIENYYRISDIYIDSYMICSLTSALDAGLHGLPIAALENDNCNIFSIDDISYDCAGRKFKNINDFETYVNKLISDKVFRLREGEKLQDKIKEDHIYKWGKYLEAAYEKVNNKVHKVYLNLNNESYNKLTNEDLMLVLLYSSYLTANKNTDKSESTCSTDAVHIKKNDNYDYTELKKCVFEYYNANKMHIAEILAEYLVDIDSGDYQMLNALALISYKMNKTWLVNKYLKEAIKYCPKNSSIILNYIYLNGDQEYSKKLSDDYYNYNTDNESYVSYNKLLNLQENLKTLFEGKQYENAITLYNKNYKSKANLYKVASVKEFCRENNYEYCVVEEEKYRETFLPYYFGSNEPEKTEKFMSPEVYIAELENVSVIGENSVIIAGDCCLYDMAKRDFENKYDLRFSTLRCIDENYAIIDEADSYKTCEQAISLIGFAPYNYYHFTIELLSRLQYIDKFEKYHMLPLLIDEAALSIPQFRELLESVNTLRHPVISVKKNQMCKVKRLIYPSYNTWMPMNLKPRVQAKPQDYLLAETAVRYIRSSILKDRKKKGYRKIYISRKNTGNVRIINEENVAKLFEAYGFEIVYPESLSFEEQVKLFSEAEYVAGATGAAFTNIIYCPDNAKIMCIIPKEYNFCIYSTIAKIVGAKCVFVDAAIVERKSYSSSEQYRVDLNYCEDCLKAENMHKDSNYNKDIINKLVNKITHIINGPVHENMNDNMLEDMQNIIHQIAAASETEEDANKYFERYNYLKNVLDVLNESLFLSDINEIKMIFGITYVKLLKLKDEDAKLSGCLLNSSDMSLSSYSLKNMQTGEENNRKIKVVFLVQTPSVWLSTESVWKAFNEDERCLTQIVQLPFFHHKSLQLNDRSIGNYLVKKGIKFKYWDEFDLIEEMPDVVFFQLPYDSTRPQEYSFEYISKLVRRTVYIQYGLGVAAGEILDYDFKLPIDQKAWRIIARSERYKNMFRKYCPTGDSNVVVLGHPKMDVIYNLQNIDVGHDFNDKIMGRKTIMWNPHHSIEKGEWSTFLEWWRTILDAFEARKEMVLIIRPHPLLFGNLKKKPGGNELLEEFNKTVNEMENVILDLSDNYLQAFKVSDAMISDASSLLMEYFPTRKPIMYLPKKDGGGLSDDGDIVNYFYQGTKESDIKAFLDMVLKGEDPMYEKRISQIDEYLYRFDGKAGYRIKEHIISSIISEGKK